MTLFIRAVAAVDKAATIKLAASGETADTFSPNLAQFSELPGSPFAYWVGEGVRAAFRRFPAVEGDSRAVRQGLATANDFRFLRAHWEIDAGKRTSKWFPFAKGGKLSPFYASLHLVIHWDEEGKELKAWADPLYDNSGWSRIIKSTEFYFRPGITWPLRASRFAPQPLPAGCIFSARGYSVFLPENDLLSGLAVLNSKPFDYLFKALLGRFGYPEFIVGVLQKLPWAEPNAAQAEALQALARAAWSTARISDTTSEISLAFILPAPLNPKVQVDTSAVLSEIQAKIDAISLDVFGLSDADKSEIEGATVFAAAEITGESEGGENDEEADDAQASDHLSLLSWSIGVAFGRFDIRLATGEREIPPEPQPFDSLPARSPGIVPDGDSPFMLCHGVLVDDPGHADDLSRRVTAVYERVSQPLPEPEALRRALARDFFPTHITMYSKSRRKAPIYWQLATPSASYSVWLYIQAFTKDTLFRVQNDYVGPKLAHEQRQLEGMRAEAGPNPSSAQRKGIEAQGMLVEELQVFFDEAKRIAPLWNPALDDGVIINFAPLWRLVPQNRAWQKELRATWDVLCRGDYDWAHLAMHLWPERVVPNCATDRSLAIAHGLEDIFWFEDSDGKWKPYATPTHPIEELVHERTSSAVKAALKSLIEAPEPAGAARRTRNGRAR